MNSSVNLILQRRKQGLNRVRVHRILNVTAVFSVVAIIFFSAGIYFLEKDPTYDSLQSQKATLTQSLTILKDKGILLFTLKNRLQSITTILKARKPYDQTLYTVINSVPGDVRIDGYALSTKTISLTVSSSSLVSLNTFTDGLTSKVSKKDTFSKLTVDNFILDDKSGRYSVGVTMQLL